MANLKSTTIDDTGFLQLPTGTTAQRPASPTAGEIRFNTDTKVCEWYDDELDAWFPTGVVPPVATGGDTVEDVDIDGVSYRIHSFTSVGENTFTVTRGGPVDYLIVAGGGGGGGAPNHGGGGGAGGLLTGTSVVTPQTYGITVGDGGIGYSDSNGENSSALYFTAIGGGAGGDAGGLAFVGGSGGGTGTRTTGRVAGTPGQGNSGGDAPFTLDNDDPYYGAGGGGGAGTPGGVASGDFGGDGGTGVASNISGIYIFYAGGGGGSAYNTTTFTGKGGLGGGGNGAYGPGSEDGQPNTGGGGGGRDERGSQNLGTGNGGSGIVIIRYRIS